MASGSPHEEDDNIEGMYDGGPTQTLGRSGGVIIDPFRFEVTLTPLDSSPPSDIRTLCLHKENRHIDVGRASRNPKRNFEPAKDNAVFRCPIMSRQHARFTASPIDKVLYIEDQGSTHGTFLHGKKIAAATKIPLRSGDRITFGTTIANGASVFSGKKICVEYKWQPRYNDEMTSANKNRAFTVPESDNEEEEPAAVSREPSVQVTDSHAISSRYSVPSESEAESVGDSSEDEDDCAELLSAPRTPQSKDKDSPITSPEELESKLSADGVVIVEGSTNLPKLKLKLSPPKSPGEGSSRQNPIDLDQAKKSYGQDQVRYMESFLSRKVSGGKTLPEPSSGAESEDGEAAVEEEKGGGGGEVDEEEEEEGPEVLSSRSAVTKTSIKKSDHSTFTNPSEPSLFQAIVSRLRPKDDQTNDNEVEEFQVEEETEQEEANEEDEDVQEELDEAIVNEEGLEPEATDEGAEDAQDVEKVSEEDNYQTDKKYDEEDDDDSLYENIGEEEMDVEHDDQDDMDEDFPIDFDEAEGFEEAALSVQNAENVKSNAQSSSSSLHYSRMIEPDMPQMAHYIPRTPSPSDAALARNPKTLGSGQTRCKYSVPAAREELGVVTDPPITEWHQTNPIDWKNLESPSSQCHHYSTGPFYLKAAMELSSTRDWPTEGARRMSQHDEEEDLGFTTPTNTAAADKPPMSIAFALNSVDKAKMATMQKTETMLKAATEGQSSKLHISNLVNSQHAEPVSSRKRKAAEISVELKDDEMDTPYFHHAMMSQDTPLPDAQPRDQPILADSSTSLGETVEPMMSSITTTLATTEISQAPEPARKKAKTSSRASGIGKFFLGVGVGAVGLAAAFLATIPASVQEEALLGL